MLSTNVSCFFFSLFVFHMFTTSSTYLHHSALHRHRRRSFALLHVFYRSNNNLAASMICLSFSCTHFLSLAISFGRSVVLAFPLSIIYLSISSYALCLSIPNLRFCPSICQLSVAIHFTLFSSSSSSWSHLISSISKYHIGLIYIIIIIVLIMIERMFVFRTWQY